MTKFSNTSAHRRSFRQNIGAMRKSRGTILSRYMSEINVTPFVDVMLVLLIVFMVTAPLISVGVPVELPKSNARELPGTKREPITLTVNDRGELYVQSIKVKRSEFIEEIQSYIAEGASQQIYLQGDGKIPYGLIAGILGDLHANGLNQISLVMAQEQFENNSFGVDTALPNEGTTGINTTPEGVGLEIREPVSNSSP